MKRPSNHEVILRPGTHIDRPAIYRIRHEIYASELGQHPENHNDELRDPLDAFNRYIVAESAGEIVGFVSLTPPGHQSYSIDKYFDRSELPFSMDDALYEVRLLTVTPAWRGRALAALLMYAAFRVVEAAGGTRIIAIGRREVLTNYFKAGLTPTGQSVICGKVTFELLTATTSELRQNAENNAVVLRNLSRKICWQLPEPFWPVERCFHGGSFFDAIGTTFDKLEMRHEIINADVNDAWFPPAPGVVESLTDHLEWTARTSPPTHCEGMLAAIAESRGVPTASLVPGSGSSSLIFRALPLWLNRESRALILNPTYGEYEHVLEEVIGCRVDRLNLQREREYDVPLAELIQRAQRGYDLIAIVNPNSPTGRLIERDAMQTFLQNVPSQTIVWIDETYLEFAGAEQSAEQFANRSDHLVVCKSLSKIFALSGMRAGYLCGSPRLIGEVRRHTPPWEVSLPAQIAVVRALGEQDYYRARWEETANLRERLADSLMRLGLNVVEGTANFLLVHLTGVNTDAQQIIEACRSRGLYLRDLSSLDSNLGTTAFRIAVKSAEFNERMIAVLEESLRRVSISAPGRETDRLPVTTG